MKAIQLFKIIPKLHIKETESGGHALCYWVSSAAASLVSTEAHSGAGRKETRSLHFWAWNTEEVKQISVFKSFQSKIRS